MKKLTKMNLDAISELLPVLDEEDKKGVLGGTGGITGCIMDSGAYSWEDVDAMIDAGTWSGGYVNGMGYVGPVSNVTGFYVEGNDSSSNLLLDWDIMKDIGLSADILNSVTGGTITTLDALSNGLGYIDLAHQAVTFAVDGNITTYDLMEFGFNVAVFAAGPLGAMGKAELELIDYGTKEIREQGKDYIIKVGSSIGKNGDYSFFKFNSGY